MTRARELSKLGNENILAVDSDNNVGVGSTIPTSKLDVTGDVTSTTITVTTIGGTDFSVSGVGTIPTLIAGGGIMTCNPQGMEITGIITATTFEGDGSSLTGIGTQQQDIAAIGCVIAGVSTFYGTSSFKNDVTVTAGGLDVVGVITSNNKVVATGLDISTDGCDIDGQTDLDELQVAGVSTFSANVLVSSAATVGLAKSLSMSDGAYINFGTADDMQIYHSGSHSVITDRGTGSLKIQSSEVSLEDASGNQKLGTIATGTGITVTGGVNASGLSTFSGFAVTPGECIKETAKITSTGWNSDADINISNGNIVYNSGGTGAGGVDLNITSDVGINTTLKVGEVLTVTGIVSCTNTAHYVDGLKIDHNSVLLSWIGGSAPTEGGGSAFDAYAFTIVKTGNAAYSVVANHSKCS